MTDDVTRPIVEFLERFLKALGVTGAVIVEPTSDGPRLNLDGTEVELLVRHRGEPLKALQHVVDMAFARRLPENQRVFVDALEYRKGKDTELTLTHTGFQNDDQMTKHNAGWNSCFVCLDEYLAEVLD